MRTWILTAGLLIAAVGSAQAQRPGGGGAFPGGSGFGGGGAGGQNLKSLVVTNKPLQEELKVSDEQIEKLKEFAAKQAEAMKGFAQFGGDEEEQIARMEVQLKLMKERVAFMKTALNAEQHKRIGQIEKQQMGMNAFTSAKIAKELAVTEEQSEKIKTINTDMNKELREMFTGGFNEESQKKMASLRGETQEKIEKVLTDDQRKKWKEMTGEAFDMAKLRPMRQDR